MSAYRRNLLFPTFNAQRNAIYDTTLTHAMLDHKDQIEYGDLDILADPTQEIIGAHEQKRHNDMKKMNDILQCAGWHEAVSDLTDMIPQCTSILVQHTAHAWQIAISKKRQEIMNARQKYHSISEHKKFYNKYPDQVDILNKSAFEKRS